MRTIQFFRKNEREVMKSLGFRPTKNSGSGWVEKEDGENDIAICQLKSTDAQSISVRLKDLKTLEYHSVVSHKTPVFAIQFLTTGEVWLLTRPGDVMIAGQKFVDIFEEEQKKTVDKTQNVCYNKGELKKYSNAIREYKKQMETEREQMEKSMKERRKVGRRRSSKSVV